MTQKSSHARRLASSGLRLTLFETDFVPARAAVISLCWAAFPKTSSADTKTAAQIGAETGDLATRARSGKLAREEITGGTFTLSNLGMFGIDRFDAIINPPQVAILAVGAGADRVIARGGNVVVAKVATLTLSCDHRVVDGAIGAQFLQALRQTIESADAL
jgi:pyruvate dehydrogenase E2 component (dihydrolipoamide acetyltransferase)